ncbi:Fur family transcriptional regulator [Streptomyces lavendulae]|uniref:Fur family transcriptional regulator n=1 Tax=Streptomyces lavendulae TaxID=1914 RepID=UPI0036E55F68
MNDRGVFAPTTALHRTAAKTSRQAVDATRPPPPGETGLPGRSTPQRTEVLQTLAGCQEFLSAQLLYARLLATGSRVSLSTVYRTLAALAAAGRADTVRDTNGERLFRYRPDADHLHHLICRQCGIGVPVDSDLVEAWADRIARTSGFGDVQHTVELAGTCATCLAVTSVG